MKKTLIFSTALFLAACSASSPNLVHTHKPILNIESTLYSDVSVSTQTNSATVKNISDHILAIQYLVTWYDKNGVTQLQDGQIDEQFQQIHLASKETATLQLSKPTAESINYRLYMALK